MLGKKSKLTQFLGLVDTVESGSGDMKTTEQDLMVGYKPSKALAVTATHCNVS